MAKGNISAVVFFLISIALIFFAINNPLTELKQASIINLLIISSIGVLFLLIMFGKGKKNWFEIQDKYELLHGAVRGIVLGFIIFIVVGLILYSLNIATTGLMFNLTDTFSASTLSSFSTTQQLFVTFLIPLVETIILVGGTIILKDWVFAPILKNFGGFVAKYMPFILAFLIIICLFGAMHFDVRGKYKYEYSPIGFAQFLTSTSDYGKPVCDGTNSPNCNASALPQVLFGAFWILLAFAYGDWIISAFAHMVSNIIPVYGVIGFAPSITAMIILFVLLIIIGFKSGISFTNTKLLLRLEAN